MAVQCDYQATSKDTEDLSPNLAVPLSSVQRFSSFQLSVAVAGSWWA